MAFMMRKMKLRICLYILYVFPVMPSAPVGFYFCVRELFLFHVPCMGMRAMHLFQGIVGLFPERRVLSDSPNRLRDVVSRMCVIGLVGLCRPIVFLVYVGFLVAVCRFGLEAGLYPFGPSLLSFFDASSACPIIFFEQIVFVCFLFRSMFFGISKWVCSRVCRQLFAVTLLLALVFGFAISGVF